MPGERCQSRSRRQGRGGRRESLLCVAWGWREAELKNGCFLLKEVTFTERDVNENA